MAWILIALQFTLLCVQIGCLVYQVRTEKHPYEILAGFSLWGQIPIILMGVPIWMKWV